MRKIQFELNNGNLITAEGTPCLIGRAPSCDVRIAAPEVSRRHAVVIRNQQEWWLIDCGSRGGTWLNDTRVSSAAKLVSGDYIGIGLSSLKFLPHPFDSSIESLNNQAMESTRPCDAEWLITSETAVAWVDDKGTLSNHTSAAATWLQDYFDVIDKQMPLSLLTAIQDTMGACVPFERRLGDERLRIHVCYDGKGDRLLVMSRLKSAFDSETLCRIGLSKAESAVVPWLIRGKRNDEIAVILSIAPKTIEKHVASILLKLNVETRTAAAWSIIELTGTHC